MARAMVGTWWSSSAVCRLIRSYRATSALLRVAGCSGEASSLVSARARARARARERERATAVANG
eukprot:1235125-Prymnesium_polylepis.1